MIFVTIGTTESFDRLLRALDSLEGEDLVVQCGDSGVRPRHAHLVEYLPYDCLVDYVRRARLVISHAGVGTIMTAHANGKRPVVVPRREVFGEAVDDHQVELARRLALTGLVTLVEDPRGLRDTVRQANPELDHLPPAGGAGLAGELGRYLATHISERLADPPND